MAVENTLAHHDTATIKAVKCFIEQAPGFQNGVNHCLYLL